jgi:proteic killer suppression protein
MEVRFATDELEALELGDNCDGKYSAAIVKKFVKIINFIRASSNEHDFRTMRSLNFERLKGKRKHQSSFRINDQWRLIVEIEKQKNGNVVVIINIEDYH